MTAKKESLVLDGASINPQPGDVVQHYKGGLYIVLMLATDEATLKDRVIYMEAKPPTSIGRRARVWDRALSDWISFPQPLTARYRNIRKATK